MLFKRSFVLFCFKRILASCYFASKEFKPHVIFFHASVSTFEKNSKTAQKESDCGSIPACSAPPSSPCRTSPRCAVAGWTAPVPGGGATDLDHRPDPKGALSPDRSDKTRDGDFIKTGGGGTPTYTHLPGSGEPFFGGVNFRVKDFGTSSRRERKPHPLQGHTPPSTPPGRGSGRQPSPGFKNSPSLGA